ncbi:MAG TPA: 3-hydroxybutyryl-CoA dehydrogenase [Lachnospiraceae bacterium]|nr:3-hydroxybutyryl-CoA dehydrogenase [Lachnospiraceae bacterium]
MKVAVIGAGVMGSGIAQTFAQCDEFDTVYMCDIKTEFAENGKNRIVSALAKRVAKGKMTQEAADAITAKLVPGLNEIAVDADLVLEAAIENMAIKKETFKSLQNDIVKNPDCIFASNTSSLSIAELSNGLAKPVIGMHFFNPAPVMKLVEVIIAPSTPGYVKDFIFETSVKLGKTPVLVNEAAGFIVNRILIPMINEGVFMYSEGVATVEEIDTAMKLGANHPMGPLALGDLVGLDVCLAIMETIFNETKDPKYRPAPLMRLMVRSGMLGRKTGIGFYDYSDGGMVPVSNIRARALEQK